MIQSVTREIRFKQCIWIRHLLAKREEPMASSLLIERIPFNTIFDINEWTMLGVIDSILLAWRRGWSNEELCTGCPLVE